MKWFEFHLEPGADLGTFYGHLADSPVECGRKHHFWDEPWNPGAYVVRVQIEEWDSCAWTLPGVSNVFEWDAGPDEKLYGPKFDLAMAFFEAGSRLNPSPWEQQKFVHCFLNAQGLSWRGEIRFHLKAAYSRAKLTVLWKPVYARRYRAQFEREAVDREARRLIREASA